MRFLREPALSAISLSFIAFSPYRKPVPLFGIMLHLISRRRRGRDVEPCDHAANRRRVLQLGDAADLVELEADQRRALRVMAADRAAGLLDLDRLCGLGHRLELRKARSRVSANPPPLGVAADAARLQRDTLMLRRAATERGES
jgi:hypothetical protein